MTTRRVLLLAVSLLRFICAMIGTAFAGSRHLEPALWALLNGPYRRVIVYMTAIILGAAVYGPPEGTGAGGRVTLADTAAHLRARWNLAQGIWSTEMIGALLMGLAAFVLQRRRQTGLPWLPASVAWIAVGVGASILTAMYAFTLGSYPGRVPADRSVWSVDLERASPGGFADLNYPMSCISQNREATS